MRSSPCPTESELQLHLLFCPKRGEFTLQAVQETIRCWYENGKLYFQVTATP